MKVHPLIADVNGRWVLMTRYLRGIRPPDQLLSLSAAGRGGDGDEAVEQVADKAELVAWFVSLIPYMAKNTMFPGLQVWNTINLLME